MSSKFFLDATGSAFAFKKEDDTADWANAVYEADTAANWGSDPASDFTDTDQQLDIANNRKAILLFKPTDGGATYDFDIKGGAQSENIEGWFTLDGGEYTSQSGNLMIRVDCVGYDYLTVVVSSVSAGTLAVELAPVPYEEAE